MFPREDDEQLTDGLTTCVECGVQWYGDTPLGRCPTCEEAWSAYRRASEAVGIEYQYARDCGWVAAKLLLSLRKDNLTFSHHKEVCSLDDPAIPVDAILCPSCATIQPCGHRGADLMEDAAGTSVCARCLEERG